MAYDVKIKSLKDLVRDENHSKVMAIKEKWNDYKLGKSNNFSCKIGTWEGTADQISYFNEIVEKSRASVQQLDYPPLTESQIAKNREILAKMRKTLADKKTFKNLNG